MYFLMNVIPTEKSINNQEPYYFIQFVKSLFGVDATKEIITKYLIGTSKKWKGATVFWQIDNNQEDTKMKKQKKTLMFFQ